MDRFLETVLGNPISPHDQRVLEGVSFTYANEFECYEVTHLPAQAAMVKVLLFIGRYWRKESCC